MKRFLVLIVLVILAFWVVRSTRPRPVWHAPQPAHRPHPREGASARELAAEARQQAQQALAEARHSIAEARQEIRQAWHEARDEMHQAWQEASDEMRQAYHEVLAADGGQTPLPPPPPPPAPPPAREQADGLPVPIVPGTRVTEAEARPPAPPSPPRPVVAISQHQPPRAKVVRPAAPTPTPARTIVGLISAKEGTAKDEARKALRREVVQWLDPEVPGSWTPPARIVDSMILETRIRPVVKDYGEPVTLYVAELKADFSPQRRFALIEAYNGELVRHRLATLGGLLAFILICLGVISGYIRADEATKGYYTNRLRMLAAAGVGAAGTIIYHLVT
jgi:hypothetical protein